METIVVGYDGFERESAARLAQGAITATSSSSGVFITRQSYFGLPSEAVFGTKVPANGEERKRQALL
jgi:hypothetical protein